jgi:DNA-binding MarR family transcriptional regulator
MGISAPDAYLRTVQTPPPGPTDPDSSSSPDERVLRALRRIGRAIDQGSRQLSGSHQLTSPQLLCLRLLQGDQVWTPSRLARAVSASQPTVTGILDRLARRGLVDRVRDEDDRRRVLLRITPAGRALVEAAPSPLQQRFAQGFARLDGDDQRAIADVLERVVQMMESEG